MPTDVAGLAATDADPDLYVVFGHAILDEHRVLRAAGGQPARCRRCGVPPEQCTTWQLWRQLGAAHDTDQPTAVVPQARRAVKAATP